MTQTQTLSRSVTLDDSTPIDCSFTFQTNQPDMAAYPRERVIKELTMRIGECGDHLRGAYNVIVGDAKDHPGKFFWKPYAPGTRGRGFYFGPITEDGIEYAGCCYTLQSPHIGELSEAIDVAVNRVAPAPKKAGPKRFEVVPTDDHAHTRFLTGFAELLAREGTSTIAIKDSDKGTWFSDLVRLSYGCVDDMALKAQVQTLVGLDLLSQVPSTKAWLKLYGFGQGARELLPERFKGLAGISLMAPKSEPADMPAIKTAEIIVDAPTPSNDLQDRVALFAKAKRYKDLAEAETTRANRAEASLSLVRSENSALQTQIKNFDQQVEARARALLDKMIKDL